MLSALRDSHLYQEMLIENLTLPLMWPKALVQPKVFLLY